MTEQPGFVSSDLGAGFSYRRCYRQALFTQPHGIRVLEIVADHFLDDTAEQQAELDLLQSRFTLIPHALDLSLGSADGLDERYLDRLARLIARVKPPWWSDHLAFTRAGGIRLGHLAPIPCTGEAVEAVARNLELVRRRVGPVPVALEPIASLFPLPGDPDDAAMDEPAFLHRICQITGCHLLLDTANAWANAANAGADPAAWLARIPHERVIQLHLAGQHHQDGVVIDSHDSPVAEPVWAFTALALARCSPKAAIIERDSRLPPFIELAAEVDRLQALLPGDA